MADGIVDQSPDHLAQSNWVRGRSHARRHCHYELHAGRTRSRLEPRGHRRERLAQVDFPAVEGQMASFCEADGAQVLDDSGQNSRLIADGLDMTTLWLVDAVEDRARRGVDHCQRRTQLVGGVLEELPPRLLGLLQVPRHGIERAPEAPEFIAASGQARALGQISLRDAGGGDLEAVERADQATRNEQPEQGSGGRGGDRHQDQADDGVLLGLASRSRGGRLRAIACVTLAVGRSRRRNGCRGLLGALAHFALELGEPGADDPRNCQRDDRGGRQRDQRKPQRDPPAQAHRSCWLCSIGRAAR